MNHLRPPLLLLLALSACGAREEGLQLHLQLALRPVGDAQVEGTTRHFTTDGGDRISLSRAHVTLSSVELFPCATSSARRWWHWLSPLGTAHAHSTSSPRRLGVPHVLGLEQPDGEVRVLGTLRPPPGSYCRARLVFGPADADAEGLATAGADMEGKTLLLEGELLPAGGGSAQPFRLEGNGLASIELSLEGLSLDEDTPKASRTIHLAYDRWLDGVALATAGAADQVLRNLAESATMEPSP